MATGAALPNVDEGAAAEPGATDAAAAPRLAAPRLAAPIHDPEYALGDGGELA